MRRRKFLSSVAAGALVAVVPFPAARLAWTEHVITLPSAAPGLSFMIRNLGSEALVVKTSAQETISLDPLDSWTTK